MAVVSLCFSGHPRAILNYREEWQKYFKFLSRYEIRIFFHCWSDHGLVQQATQGFAEGQYVAGRFTQYDELLSLLRPAAFEIASHSDALDSMSEGFPQVFLTGTQAPRRAILSQLYSVERSNTLRETYEKAHGPSDVVIKLRFDLRPEVYASNEIDYIIQHSDEPVIFAPYPHYHPHIGGGGGCTACHDYFASRFRIGTIKAGLKKFFERHAWHSNDICDLYAFGSPRVMSIYSRMFSSSAAIWRNVQEACELTPATAYEFIMDTGRDPRDCILWHANNMEEDPYFYPEKIIRFHARNILIIHAESRFVIARR